MKLASVVKPEARVDLRQFTAVTRELARISGTSQKDVIRAEAQAVLTTTGRRTKAASLKKIRQRHATVWQKDGGREWYHLEGKAYFLKNRLPDAVYREIDKRAKERVKELSGRRGWAKKGWYAIGMALRLSVPVPAYAQKAEVPGTTAELVTAGFETQKDNGKAYTLIIQNDSKIAKRLRLGRVIGTALRGRISYFHANLRRGVFRDINKAVSKYKGITFRGS